MSFMYPNEPRHMFPGGSMSMKRLACVGTILQAYAMLGPKYIMWVPTGQDLRTAMLTLEHAYIGTVLMANYM